MTKKLAAEFIGTFTLVLFGCGSAVLAGFGIIGQDGIAWAFGLAIVAMAYGIGPVSGCHVNPAVSFGAWIAGRMPTGEMLGYWAAQCLGAVVGAGVLLLIASGAPDYSLAETGLGQNGYGVRDAVSNQGSPGDYSLISGAVFEVVATFIFVVVILGVTQRNAAPQFAGLAIGLTLVAIHIVGIQVTGVSVNPARSLGPAVWVLGDALMQLWLFIVAPMLGAGLAGWAFRVRLLTADEA
ncbi:aquaporin [Candidatus Viadribacter manganicus]|uniref:Porin n=1 Tax=Candidatus Viadribacter manganicus TaxID=1759059 RepID=A0A1B1ANF7_9PROT|nr:aquaporin [Candidatus Viadribacter manganicus]ANP48108.1 porin [Candidatus Viadribacter manganicus]